MMVLSLGCTEAGKEKTSRVEELPFYDEASYTPRWIKPEDLPNDYHRIPSFRLTNHRGEQLSEEDLDGKVSVIDFFFTTCPGICSKMTSNMKLVQEAFLKDEYVLILSHSVMPAYDSVSILAEYAMDKGIEKKDWHLLTGDRSLIYDLGRNHYFVEEDLGLGKDADEFIHTENFVLLDQQRRIRGIYNGLSKSSVLQLVADIKTLKEAI